MIFDFSGRVPGCLVLDMQLLFTSPTGPFENRHATDLVAAVNTLTTVLRGRGMPIIHARYALQPDLSDAGLLRDHPVVSEGFFSRDSPWTDIAPDIELAATDYRLCRSRPNAFFGGELMNLMSSIGLDALILAGLSVNNAISATARAAFEQDIPVILPKTCAAAAPWEHERTTYFAILDQWTAQVVDDIDAMIGVLDA